MIYPFVAVPARSLRDHSRLRLHWRPRPHVLAVLTCPESAGHAQLRTCIAKFGYLAKSDANTGYERKKFDKNTSVDDDTTLNDWVSSLAEGGGAKKRFQCCLNPNSPRHFLYFTAIQGHAGGNAIDTQLQDNVLWPEGFAEYIYHDGNVNELNSTIRNGLIPGGTSLKRGRHSVFFTTANLMEDDNGMVRNSMRPDQTKHPSIQKYLETSSNIRLYWYNLKREDCNFTKHGHMQLFSTTHSSQFALRKRYVWKQRRSSTERDA